MKGVAQTLADHNRQYHTLLDLVADTGAAQAADLAAELGETPAGGFWRVPPLADRHPGTTIEVLTPSGSVVKSRIPKNGPTAETIKILTQSLERWGFNPDEARAEQRKRIKQAAAAGKEAADAAERDLHTRQRQEADARAAAAPKRKKKKWPREEYSREDVSPLQALNMLDDPGDGTRIPRPISRPNVDRLKRIINEGRWNPVMMYVDWFGQVVDGRHRLTAISEGEQTVPCRILYGVDPALFTALDTPMRRTGAHTLYTNRLVSREQQGRMSSALKLLHDVLTGKPMESWGREHIDNDMIIGLALQYPDITDAMASAHLLHTGRRDGVARFMPSSAITFCYLAARAWPGCGDTLDRYIMAVTTGEDVGGNDPRKRLYNLMVGAPRGRRSSGAATSAQSLQLTEASPRGRKSGGAAKSAQSLQLMLLLKIWNMYCKNEQLKGAAAWREDEGVPTPVTEAQVVLAR